MKRNSKNWYCKRETNLREKNHDKKYRHSPGREKPTNGELSAVHRDVYYTFVERCIVWWPGDMSVVFVHGKSLKSLYCHSCNKRVFFSGFLLAKEQTQDWEESSDDGDDKKPVEKFELVTVLVGKAGFQRNHLWKGHKWYLAKENLRNNVVVVKYLRKPFIQKCLKQRGLIVKNQEKHGLFRLFRNPCSSVNILDYNLSRSLFGDNYEERSHRIELECD